MWVLIVWLWTNPIVAAHYEREAACEQAGQIWSNTVPTIRGRGYVCLPVKAWELEND